MQLSKVMGVYLLWYIHSLRFDRSVGVKSKLWTKSPELTLTLIWKCQSSYSLALGHLLATSDIYAGKASFPRRVLGQWSNINLKIDWRIFFFLLVWKVFWLEDESITIPSSRTVRCLTPSDCATRNFSNRRTQNKRRGSLQAFWWALTYIASRCIRHLT